MTFGFKHDISKDVWVKGRINQGGKMDFALKAELKKDWDLIASMGVDSTAIGGKSEAVFGFGIGGKI